MLIVDDSDMNADWIKTRSWDLPTDPAELEALFGPDWYATLSRLPAWLAAPPQVKAAAPVTVVKFAPGLVPVLKHGSPGEKGYEQKHPNGRAGNPYAAWGDHAERIQQAEGRGPSEDTLRAMASSGQVSAPDDNEIADWIESEDPDSIDTMIDNDYSLYQRRQEIDEAQYPDEWQRDEAIRELRRDAAWEMAASDPSYYADAMGRPGFYDDDEAREAFGEVFDYSHTGVNRDGKQVTVDASVKYVESLGGAGDGIRVTGDLTVDGRGAGYFVRDFTVDGQGRLVVSHEWMRIEEPDGQGTGFATEFNAHAEDYYASHGIDRIKVHAALENGGYTWASHGFDFDPAQASINKGRIEDRVKGFLADHAAGRSQATPDDLAALTKARDRMALDPSDPDYPTPYEVSRIGWTRGATTWPGKEVLVGSDWFGVKPLRPEGRRKSKTEQEPAPPAPPPPPPQTEIPGQKTFGFDT